MTWEAICRITWEVIHDITGRTCTTLLTWIVVAIIVLILNESFNFILPFLFSSFTMLTALAHRIFLFTIINSFVHSFMVDRQLMKLCFCRNW